MTTNLYKSLTSRYGSSCFLPHAIVEPRHLFK